MIFFSFFFNDTATTEIYTLSLHDALPILFAGETWLVPVTVGCAGAVESSTYVIELDEQDRKSTRLNSSHVKISYAVFCLKTKKHGAKCEDGEDAKRRTSNRGG